MINFNNRDLEYNGSVLKIYIEEVRKKYLEKKICI